jgi:MFS family permease
VVSVLALSALWVTPLIAGTLVSAWSAGDPASARRMRRITAICAVVAVAGAVGFVATAAVAGATVWIAVLIAVVGLAAFPASVALGGAARRVELRRDPPATDADDELSTVDEDLRRGRRNGVLGAAIGLVLALAADVAIGVSMGTRRDDLLTLIGFAVAFAVLGAGVGRLTVMFRLAQQTRALLGSDYGLARRIGRVVRGKQQAEVPEEEARAARYARIAMRTIPFQTRTSLLTMVSVVALQVPTAVSDGLDPVRIFIFALFVATFVAILPLQVVQVGRLRRYAEAHPVADVADPEESADTPHPPAF